MTLLWAPFIISAAKAERDASAAGKYADITLRASSETLRSRDTLQEFKIDYADKMDRLVLICRAMWELIRASNNLSEDDLLKKVTEVDLRDGTLDGKMTIPPKKCPNCNRLMSRRHTHCIYCGAEELLDSAFDLLSD